MTLRSSLTGLLALVLAALAWSPTASAQNDLILTGIFDGDRSGGLPKGIELYVVNDIADLSLYAVGSANNGGGTDGPEFYLSGSASAGDYIHVATNLDDFFAYFGFDPDLTDNAVNINGDDALEVFYDDDGEAGGNAAVVIDTYGVTTTNGDGETWDYTDGWGYRNDNTGPDGSTFVQANWQSEFRAFDGAQTNSEADPVFPIGTFTFGDLAPTVALTDPEDGDEEVALESVIEITFSESIDFEMGAFELECFSNILLGQTASAIAPVSFTPSQSVDGLVVTLTPDADLPDNNFCRVTVNAELVSDRDDDDENNNDTLADDFVFDFTTELVDDAPFVASIDPEDGAENVARDANITITFSEDVFYNGNTFLADAIDLSCSISGDDLDFDVTTPQEEKATMGFSTQSQTRALGESPSFTTLVINPVTDLEVGDVCMVTLTGSLFSDKDNVDPPDTIDGTFTSTFTVDRGILVSFTAVQQAVSETIGTYALEVMLSDFVQAPATVVIQLQEGSPEDLDGFSQTTLQLTPEGGQTYTVEIPITDDGVREDNETFVFQLVDPMGNDPEGLGIGDQGAFVLILTDGQRPPVSGDGAPAWVNELHYDNGGADENEFIEIVVDTEAIASAFAVSETARIAADPEDLSVVLYNGSNGTPYATYDFADFDLGTTAGRFEVYSVDAPGLQNGSPDGVALFLGDELLQFLSYEGTFEATQGPAAGVTSVDIGVAEDGQTTSRQALVLQGDGNTYTDFVWAGPVNATPGDINVGQTLGGQGGGDGGGDGGGQEVTIAEARALGVGATVTVEGIVTRAEGDFAYVQQDSAAISLRQVDSDTFGELFNSGDLVPGTTVRLTGTLSQFRETLQINGADLTAFEVTGSADVPEPQTLTLAEIAANGENYEDELVRVVRVTVDGFNTFEAASTYEVTDGSGNNGAVTLRIPNADDSTVDGTPFPTGPVDIVGIVGQFSLEDPASGYQILAIDAADITPALGVAVGDALEDNALSLTVANPIRSATTVTFGLPEAGAASVELYDVLGRRVSVVAGGVMAAGPQTAQLEVGTLAPGVYVLRLQAGDAAVTRTVTVVR